MVELAHNGDGALAHERDRERMGADALARDAADGVGGVEEGPIGHSVMLLARRASLVLAFARTALAKGAWPVGLLLFGYYLAFWPAHSAATPPEDIPGYCRSLYEVPALQDYCITLEERARQRLSLRRDIDPGVRSACIATSNTWSVMEACVARVTQAARYAWALWSFGGELVDLRLFRDERWTMITEFEPPFFDSPASCEAAIAEHVNRLGASVLRIEGEPPSAEVRVSSERVGPRDRFVATFSDGRTFSWTFHCVRANTMPYAESP